MIIAISGSNGFIGSSLKNKFGKDFDFIPLKRDASDEVWVRKIKEADIVINLAGAPVIQRWTKKNKKIILESRVNTTQRIVNIINGISKEKSPRLLISASAIGIYPNSEIDVSNEESVKYGKGFLSDVVKKWEYEALKLNNKNTRLIITRIGVVLGKDGGLLKKTIPLFKLGLGGNIASGKQSLSFIHIDDLIEAFLFFINNDSTKGVFNLVSPNLTTNEIFTTEIGRILKRPTLITVPGLVLKIVYGKAAEIMIKGEKVYPENLLKMGFTFKYDTIQVALQHLLG